MFIGQLLKLPSNLSGLFWVIGIRLVGKVTADDAMALTEDGEEGEGGEGGTKIDEIDHSRGRERV